MTKVVSITIREDAAHAALALTRSCFPGAPAAVVWADSNSDRAVVLVEVEMAGGTKYLHQVVCRLESGVWFDWTAGPGPAWLPIDEPLGVAVQASPIEQRTTAVIIADHNGGRRQVEVRGNRFFHALWDVSMTDKAWEWPTVAELIIAGEPVVPAFPDAPVSANYLIEVYLRHEQFRSADDFWAWELIMEAVERHPKACWELVCRAIGAASAEETIDAIAAGPLENLVRRHSDLLGEDIAIAASSDPKLRRALAEGVWTPAPRPAQA